MAYTFEETLSLFLEEAREGLEVFENALLAIEKSPENKKAELVNTALRVVHSIKGSAGYFGFTAIDELAQALELILGNVRSGDLTLTSESIGILLVGGDKLAYCVENTSETTNKDIKRIVSSINSILEQNEADNDTKNLSSKKIKTAKHGDLKKTTKNKTTKKSTKSKTAKKPTQSKTSKTSKASKNGKKKVDDQAENNKPIIGEFTVPPNILEVSSELALAANSHGKTLFAFKLDFDGAEKEKIKSRHDEISSLGQIVDTPAENWIRFKTVLDHELVTATLDVPPDFVIRIPLVPSKENHTNCTPTNNGSNNNLNHLQANYSDGLGSEQLVELNVQSATSKENADIAFDESLSPPAINDEDSGNSAGGRKTSTVRISVNLLDELVNLAGELVLSRNQIERAGALLGAHDENLNMVIQRLSAVTSQLREKIMETRMQRIDNILSRLPRVIRDLSVKLSKKVRMEVSGGEVELDRTILEAVSEPLVHMVRNALDHGFETPEVRIAAGKPAEGILRIEALHAGDFVILKFSDDGKGIDHREILAKAIKKKLITKADAAAMSSKDALSLLTTAGFSTRDEVTAVSGLGVGLDVVKTQIERLGGSVIVKSTVGRGTTFTLRLPITLAIVPAVFVKSGPNTFGILLKQVQKLERVRYEQKSEKIISVNGVPALKNEGHLIPLVRLADIIGLDRTYNDPDSDEIKVDRRHAITDRRTGNDTLSNIISEDNEDRQSEDRRKIDRTTLQIVVLGHEDNRFGVIVDAILDNEEIVVKPCPKEFSFNPCYMGTTILGDGNLAAILDPEGMIRKAGLDLSNIGKDSYREIEDISVIDQTKDFLIFETGSGHRYGIALPSVGKLERLTEEECHSRGGLKFFQRDERTLRVIKINDFLYDDEVNVESSDLLFAIIPFGYENEYAIIANKIVDTIDIHNDTTAYKTEELGNKFLKARFALNNNIVLVPDIDAIIASVSLGEKK